VEIHKAADAVAANVKKFRLERGWTQGELAARMTSEGYPTSLKQVSNTELGARQPNPNDLFAFKVVFKVSLDDMYGVDPVPLELISWLNHCEYLGTQLAVYKDELAQVQHEIRIQQNSIKDAINKCRELLPDEPNELKELIRQVKAIHGRNLAHTLTAIAEEC
jgi:transcriptional regulator with XRE-family HTH domain